ncbi:MAG: class I SAM-dependent methyltransferase [Motiliproteus sp.]
MKADPDFEAYQAKWVAQYENLNYRQGLSGWVLSQSHQLIERDFGPDHYFPTVVEVGAGTGQHLNSLRHRFDRYQMTDLSTHFLEQIDIPEQHKARVEIAKEDATALSYKDDSVDRLIACHVLEHLSDPHQVLREWVRVLRPGGVLSIVLPCDPGLLWRLGRTLGPRRNAEAAGIAYDYWMAREHINAISNLTALLNYYFDRPNARWWPTKLPSVDFNLIYGVNIRIGSDPALTPA